MKHSMKDRLQPIMTKASQTSSHVMGRFSRFSADRQIAIIFLGVLTLVLVFLPLVNFSSIDGAQSTSLRFLGWWFWKSSLLMAVVLMTLWWWHIAPTFKHTIHHTLGFQDNDYLFTFFLLFVWFGLLVGIQDAAMFVDTTKIGLGLGYYVLLLLLIIGMLYSLYRLLDDAKITRKTSFLGFMKSRKKSEKATVASLFEDEDVDVAG